MFSARFRYVPRPPSSSSPSSLSLTRTQLFYPRRHSSRCSCSSSPRHQVFSYPRRRSIGCSLRARCVLLFLASRSSLHLLTLQSTLLLPQVSSPKLKGDHGGRGYPGKFSSFFVSSFESRRRLSADLISLPLPLLSDPLASLIGSPYPYWHQHRDPPSS